MAERPVGWRPFTDEQRAGFADKGLSEEAIADLEETNEYTPVRSAVWALELGIALLHAGGKRFGASFAKDVKTSLERRVRTLSASDVLEDKVEAPIVAHLLEAMDWDAVIARASDPDWSDEHEPAAGPQATYPSPS